MKLPVSIIFVGLTVYLVSFAGYFAVGVYGVEPSRLTRTLEVSWTHSDPQSVIGFNLYSIGERNKRTKQGFVRGSFAQIAGTGNTFGAVLRNLSPTDRVEVEVVSVDKGVYRLPTNVKAVDVSKDSAYPTVKKDKTILKFRNFRNSVAEDGTKQREIAASDAIKIEASGTGMFRVTRAELESTGFDLSGSSKNWQLFYNGIEQAINVGPDGSFIEFYGRDNDTPETGLTSYYFVRSEALGKRISPTYIRPIAPQVEAKNFESRLSRSNRIIYVTTVLNGSESNYFGEVINTPGSTISLDIPGLDTESQTPVELDVRVQGLTFGTHTVTVNINGNDYEAIRGGDRNNFARTYEIPASLMQETGNSIILKSANGASDISLLDKIDVKYRRKFVAHEGQIEFRNPHYKKVEVSGFASDSLRVLDLTNENEPRLVQNAEPFEIGPNDFRTAIAPARSRRLFAFEDSAVQTVESVERNIPSSLSSSSNNAELIVISHSDWLGAAQDYGLARNAAGVSTLVANIDDVFDEFSFGETKADAIREFLSFAFENWSAPPKYVLLLGDGTYDARNISGEGEHNKIPVKLVDTLYEETASDEALVDFDGDGLSEIAIGRIPVRSAADVISARNKVTTFENGVAGAPSRGFLCASDVTAGFDFEGLCDDLTNEMPVSIPTSLINRGDPNSRQDLLAEINTGKYFINYSGHGTASVWASTNFFGQADIASLTNETLPVYTMLTCLNGYFIRPVQDSLSEELIRRENGGAVAVWSSSGTTTPDFQSVMANRFYEQLGSNEDVYRIGDLVNDAKSALSGGADVRRSWVLLGDPSLKIKPGASKLKNAN